MNKGRVHNFAPCPDDAMGVYRKVAATPWTVGRLLLLTLLATGGSILFGQTASSSAGHQYGAELTQELASCAVTLVPSETKHPVHQQ